MKMSDIKAMTNEELTLAERNTAEEQWQLRFQHNTGQLANTADLRKSRKTRARILTTMNERKQGITVVPGTEE
jgi:ribosomal protein L29